CQKYSDSPYSF
nr:immunoglobulin light chain junction region [Macaca mulatta]MOW61747.1 immunoglobulin light chain junction region [Macaca mulatta]MOW61860.1 immunoglobulin light chain junction region [Macaca mulatta]MOW61869.1 immunoglobulin light chain junction region [Macaca mulatta]MOW61910.1 immunoglobulin light chain junction region [Macaca mulatta]